MILVAAINFGAIFSGIAFTFYDEFRRDPSDIETYIWFSKASSTGHTPSVLLLKPNKALHSFGYEAEMKYASLVKDSEQEGWLYFKGFKTLHQYKSLRRTKTIKDANGQEMPAKTIFTMTIKYLKNHLVELLKSRTMLEDSILWVVTVPAIWDDGAKQFMTEVAAEAGIPRKQLLLVSEPEAATIYCNNIPMEAKPDGRGRTETNLFEPGTQYMVLDAGETSDITVLEVKSNQTLQEVHHVTDGAWGWDKVGDAFYQFLVTLTGIEVLTTFKVENEIAYTHIFDDFETMISVMKPDSESNVNIDLPPRLLEIFKEQTQETLTEALTRTRYAKRVELTGNKLRVHPKIFKDFYNQSLQGIIQVITDTMESFQGASESKFLLVSDFVTSPMVLKAIRESFPDNKVIAPTDPALAVMKGAVIFGHIPHSSGDGI
ncbi:heat shock 70 kDa protein 12A-like [Ostrea edulis]|uniref:heat shock 70 kDa protein 12A-like n=1 Tax=Ostrea edulis TaxID=37623 RepID=UPI0024AEA603|nr:heat shock 70 kDa protein 12A-like [Ostrea edulis]